MLKTITIGLLRETKTPIDNRVPLTPNQCRDIMQQFPQINIVVQPSEIRAFSNSEYKFAGVTVKEDISDSDYLLGIKEVEISKLLPEKKYVFFGHFAKMQDYNLNLCRTLLKNKNTFIDWEYLTDDSNKRIIAFGKWAGIVGVYNALRLYGLRNQLYDLPAPTLSSTVESIAASACKKVPIIDKKGITILLTGSGRVANGAELFLNKIGICKYSGEENQSHKAKYIKLSLEDLVKRRDKAEFDSEDFKLNPHEYVSRFDEYSRSGEILISCHYWSPSSPKYLTADLLATTTIDTVADVTCDINGSIATTTRPSTHSDPFYGTSKVTLKETSYLDLSSIGVMAVDTLPNALPRESSQDFGWQIIEYLIPEILLPKSKILEKATIINNGKFTSQYKYLESFAKSGS